MSTLEDGAIPWLKKYVGDTGRIEQPKPEAAFVTGAAGAMLGMNRRHCDNLAIFPGKFSRLRPGMSDESGGPFATTSDSALPQVTPVANDPTTRPRFFLRTKLLPPRPAPELLSRPRLTERLKSNLDRPVTLVTANAGSGKTTLVADFVRNHDRRFVWYQLDHTDADPSVFLGYLSEGISHISPHFGSVISTYISEAANELATQPERAVDVLLNEILEHVDRPFMVVLDDYHHLGSETAVHVIVDRLLQYVPDVMHVIIISRDLPPLSLARLRAQSALAVIDRNELLFTDDETRQLFRKVFDLDLTAEQLAEYRERTHGWITALQLVRQVAQRQALAINHRIAPETDLSEILRQSERDIFDYFAEEVFADESEEIQQLLVRISLLERVDAETCSSLYPDSNCRVVLPALVRRNVFLTVASDDRGEEYRLHPLFQAFLRKRFRTESGRAAVAEEHIRCAGFYLSKGALDQGMHHLLAAEDFDTCARMIAERGAEWLQSGALSTLSAFLKAIPATSLEAHPRSIAFEAEIERIRGNYDVAESSFRRAASLLNSLGDAEGEAEALHSLATIERRRGNCKEAFVYLDRAIALTDESSRVRIKCGNTRGLCLLATGDLAAAEREFRAALHWAEEKGDDHYARLIAHNLGLPAGMRGDFGEALRWSRRMLRDENEAGPIPQDATGHLNVARFHFYRGEFEACERHLNMALERSQLFNLTSLLGEIFEAYGSLFRERGEVQKALEYFGRAQRAYGDAGIDIHRTELQEEEALLWLRFGETARAKQMVKGLLTSRQAVGDTLRCNTASLTLGRILLSLKEYQAASAAIEPALAYFRPHHLYYYEAQASLGMAIAQVALGNEPAMMEHLRRVLDLAARFDYDYWLKHEISASAELLSNPDVLELLPPDIRERAVMPGAGAPHPVAKSADSTAEPLTDLTINLLGPVEIFRDAANPLPADAWTTRRSRDILCFIVSRPHRRASKDVIIDTFWTDSDFDAVEKNFHPTVSHIRKALNSRQPLKQNFLLYRDGDYQLNQEFSYRIDIEEFDRQVQAGDEARRKGDQEAFVQSYERAIALYRGEFMQGSYEEWVEDQRAYYKDEYLRLLETLAAAAQKAGDWSHSMHLAQKILKDDPFREDVHCTIMKAHAALGNRAAVKDQFETLRRLLKEELGVEPAAETQRTFRELMK